VDPIRAVPQRQRRGVHERLKTRAGLKRTTGLKNIAFCCVFPAAGELADSTNWLF
jgi:hypothetical protein